MIAFVLLFIAQVFAQDRLTLAVMPLEKASASEEYDGLGKALAGMLVSDLSAVDGMVLVERDRLQALLAEMELADSGFLDEQTAQRLGSGLGAQFILTGSYSVVADAFILDARVIEVETGTIKKAANASGLVSDFVTVEKDLVEDLIEGLEVTLTSGVRRKLYSQAPTEDFGAFQKYGEGLQRQDEGDYEAAKQAYEAAVDADPEFEAARAALNEVRGLVETYKSERSDRFTDAYIAMNTEVLSVLPAQASVGDSTPEVVDFAVRVTALQNMEQHCVRYEELFAYAESRGWRPEVEREFYNLAPERAEALGLVRPTRDEALPEVSWAVSLDERFKAVSDPLFLVLGEDSLWDWKRNDPTWGLLVSLSECFAGDPQEQLRQVDRITRSMEKAGFLETRVWERRDDGVTWHDLMDVVWLSLHSRRVGASPEFARRSETLLSRTRNTDLANEVASAREAWAIAEMDHVVRDATNTERWKAWRLGLTISGMAEFLEAVTTNDGEVLELDDPTCVYLQDHYATRAQGDLQRLEEQLADDSYFAGMMAGQSGGIYASFMSLGCVKGTPGRFENLDEVTAFIDGAVLRYREAPRTGHNGVDCKPIVEGMERMSDSVPSIREYGSMPEPQVMDTMVSLYSSAYQMGCFDTF